MAAAPTTEPGEDPPFGLRSHREDGVTVVALEGDLDLATAAEAGEAIERAQAEPGTVLLDLHALRFIDSSGLRVVLEAQRRAADAGDRAALQVAPGDGQVRRVFELSGVGGLLTLVDVPGTGSDA